MVFHNLIILEKKLLSITNESRKSKKNQVELTKLIKVSRQTISAMEAGKYVPSTVLALRLAHVFEIEVSEMFQLSENEY